MASQVAGVGLGAIIGLGLAACFNRSWRRRKNWRPPFED